MIHGEDLIIAIGGTPLAASKSCNVNKSQSFIEVASPTSSAWESFIPTKRGWKISSDCLMGTMDAYKTLDAAWKAGTALTIRFYDTEFNENETGTAYIENLDLTATKGNLAKMSVSLKGSGPLSDYATPISVNRELKQASKFYYSNPGSTKYSVSNYSATAKIYSGQFTLTRRTLVRISFQNIGYSNVVLLSNSNGIVTKAQNADTITSADYTTAIKDSGQVWLNAGTWYVVESSQNYAQPAYLDISH